MGTSEVVGGSTDFDRHAQPIAASAKNQCFAASPMLATALARPATRNRRTPCTPVLLPARTELVCVYDGARHHGDDAADAPLWGRRHETGVVWARRRPAGELLRQVLQFVCCDR